MRPNSLVERPLEWTRGGGEGLPVAVSSRVRLARNLRDFPFPQRCDENELDSVTARIRDAVAGAELFRSSEKIVVDDLEPLSRRLLVEQHLLSPALAAGGRGRLAVIDGKGIISLLINEEDHLRVQVVLGGLSLREASRIAFVVHEALQPLGFAYDEGLGFLTACPTNAGTGMRASVMIHIPALELLGQVNVLVREANRLGLTVRGTYGEGTEAMGALYQISNQVTLGPTEDDLVEKVAGVTLRIAEEEERARRTLAENRFADLEDRAWRAWGALRYARSVSVNEALAHLSLIHMAGALAIVPPLTVPEWNALVLGVQPAHLEARSGGDLSPQERDRARGDFLRARLARKI
ncbi:MAG: ATP--guanido phosphotransferase [Synergistaceae bacterium]|nr:ATP--guanido phosphotransferase [Synergistaceae bacterium]